MPDISQHLILSQTTLNNHSLQGKVAVVTGAGGGIGYEAARALLYLGGSVIIAEINRQSGKSAAKKLSDTFGSKRVMFIHTDIGNRASVQRLVTKALRCFNKVDILINNATIAPLGRVKDVPIATWDASYRVNFRGPVMLIQALITQMLSRNFGVIINISSTGTAYMGAYETFKSAQVQLSTTMDAELEGTDVVAFTIGPGFVPTETAKTGVAKLAPQLGMSLNEFYEINKSAMLSIEEAGTGFAAAAALAKQYQGQEISSLQALRAVGYTGKSEGSMGKPAQLTPKIRQEALRLSKSIHQTFEEQSEGWKSRSLFERQWMLRDFKKHAGMPVDTWDDLLNSLIVSIEGKQTIPDVPLEQLSQYYEHLAELAKGYEKDQKKLEDNLQQIYHWKQEVDTLIGTLSGSSETNLHNAT